MEIVGYGQKDSLRVERKEKYEVARTAGVRLRFIKLAACGKVGCVVIASTREQMLLVLEGEYGG